MKTAMERYLSNIAKYPLLSKKEEVRISGIFRSSQDERELERAENILIVSNLRLVIKWASHYYRKCYYDPGLTIADLISSGNVGLITMVRKRTFDSGRGRFSTFISPYIKRYIIRALLSTGKIIRHPERHYGLLQQIQKIKLEQGEITDKEIMKKLKISAFLLASSEACLPVDRDADMEELLKTTEFPDHHPPISESICNREAMDYLKRKVNALKPREKEVFNRIMAGETQQKIGKSFHLTYQRVGRIFRDATSKLKRSIRRDIKMGVFDPGKMALNF